MIGLVVLILLLLFRGLFVYFCLGFIVCMFMVFFFKKGLLYVTLAGHSRTLSEDQAGLKLKKIHLPLTSKCWAQRRLPPQPGSLVGFNCRRDQRRWRAQRSILEKFPWLKGMGKDKELGYRIRE